ncbi:YpoC family protein [Halalkalibacter krulwichiae]|uniref:YpoC-like domain-containing protein n=1 Tax=Halalkalibacter krulwichiae TaxID=199441 RepID=A0A1X9MFQ5_9BACI|nr:hypothetical protein [Halalkalibacter krulwichiae]ARK30351.1 hypothetical protein BkAM31D_11220 [Halalkalibacter krulwichiae]
MTDLPKSFQVDPFYQQSISNVPSSSKSLRDILNLYPFYYDITEEQTYWVEPNHYIIQELLDWWEEEEPKLKAYYQERDTKKARTLIITMSAVFIDLLFWINHQKVPGLIEIDFKIEELPYKPVNCNERIHYVISSPSQYHAYIQLNALFNEIKKIYARKRVLEDK